MRIAAFAISPPYPPDDGTRILAWQHLRRLAETDEVTLITWAQSCSAEVHRALETTFAGVVLLGRRRLPVGIAARLARRARGLAGGLPPWIQVMIEASEPAPALDGFDLAIAQDDAAWFLMPAMDCPRIVTRHNVFSETIGALAREATLGAAHRAAWRIDLPMWIRFDRALSTTADASVVTTPEAAAALLRLVPEADVTVVTNGVDVPPEPLPEPTRPVAVFVGGMNYAPNVDAAVRMAREIWPEVRRRVPGAELRIIGHSPTAAVRRLAGPGIVVTGSVPTVAEAARGARLGLVPLRAGSGIKNKTIELMAMGLPVVASPVGAEGIPFGRDKGLIVRDTSREIAAEACTMLERPGEARALGLAARDAVGETFTWESAARTLRETLARVTDSRRARRT